MILRETLGDGEYSFWTVEVHSFYMEEHWHIVGGYHLAKIPYNLRFRRQKGYHKMLEPVRSFGANGTVWQRTGNNGFETEEEASKLLELVAKHNPSQLFRVVHVRLTMYRLVTEIREHPERSTA